MYTTDPIVLTVFMFGCMMLFMLLGVPLFYTLGITSTATVLLLWGTGGVEMQYFATLSIAYSFPLAAIPLFIFAGVVLERSGIGDEFFEMVYKTLGGIRGGLAVGMLGICAVVAAIVGQTGPATIMMGLIALPAMLKRGYDKRLAVGAVMAGGALGILIPPSVTMIMYGFLAQQSTGRLFAAGIIPGIILCIMYQIYVLVRCRLQPHMGPAIPQEERGTLIEKIKSIKGILLPFFLVFMVLGLILFGVTSTTEAAAVGAFGSLLCAAIRGNLTWKVLRESVYNCGKIIGCIMWIIIPAVAFSKIYQGLGAQAIVENFIAYLGVGRYAVIVLMMISYLILGCFLETGAIIFLTIPLYVPIIIKLGFDPIWFGILYVMSEEAAYLTPPYGFNLFYMKAIAPKEVMIEDIYWSILPYVGIQMVAIALFIIFPQIVLWLPNYLFSR